MVSALCGVMLSACGGGSHAPSDAGGDAPPDGMPRVACRLSDFAPPASTPTGTLPEAIAIGDLDGDTKPDLVTANAGASSISVLLGNGDATFRATDYATGTEPSAIAIADLDGDGKPDIVTANSDGSSISVLINHGDGTFAAHADVATGPEPGSVRIADVNGDGKLDVITGNFPRSISVLINHGDGTFAAHVDTTTGGGTPEVMAATDLDGDHKLDLITLDRTMVHVLIGDGTGHFTFPRTTSRSLPRC